MTGFQPPSTLTMAAPKPGGHGHRDLVILGTIFASLCVCCGLLLCCCLYHCMKRRRRRQELQARRRTPKVSYAHPRYLDAYGQLMRQEGTRPRRFHSRWPSQMPVHNSGDEPRVQRQRLPRRRPLPPDLYETNGTYRMEGIRRPDQGYMSGYMYRPHGMRTPEIPRPRQAHLRNRPRDLDPIWADQGYSDRERDSFRRRRSTRIRPQFNEPERGRRLRRSSQSREEHPESWKSRRGNETQNKPGVGVTMQEPPSINLSRSFIDESSASPPYSGDQSTRRDTVSERSRSIRPMSDIGQPVPRPASPLIPQARSRSPTISLPSTCVEVNSNSIAERRLHVDDFSSGSDSMFAPISPVASTWRKDDLRQGSWERWTDLARSDRAHSDPT